MGRRFLLQKLCLHGAVGPATCCEAEVDESWIDQMEQKEAKEREASRGLRRCPKHGSCLEVKSNLIW